MSAAFASGDTIWIAEEDSIWKFAAKSREGHRFSWSGGHISHLTEADGNVYVCGARGLFICSAANPGQPLAISTNVGNAHFALATDSGVLIASERGLARYAANGVQHLAKIPIGGTKRYPGRTFAMAQTGSGIWLGTAKGLYRFDPRTARMAPVAEDINAVYAIREVGTSLWIGTRDGLYRSDNYDSGAPKIVEMEFDWPVYSIAQDGNTLWLGASIGLFKTTVSRDTAPSAVFESADEMRGIDYVIARYGWLWLGTERGLYVANASNEPWLTDIDVTVSKHAYPDEPLSVSWKVKSFDGRTSPNLLKSDIIVKRSGTNTVTQVFHPPTGSSQMSIKLPLGNFSIVVQVMDLFGHRAQSEKAAFKVNRRYSDMAAVVVKFAAAIYSTVLFIVFLILVIGARWSRKCFIALTDSRVRKLTLFLGISLEHVPFIRNWVFERYFRKLKDQFGKLKDELGNQELKHVTVNLTRPHGTPCLSTGLLNEMKPGALSPRQLWLQGGPGTGKTAVLHFVVHQFCKFRTLSHAWLRFRFIPIVIHLRDFNSRELVELAGKSLESFDMPFRDKAFLARLLETGAFALFVDGLNEGGFDEEVREFGLLKPHIPLLVTSQTTAANLKIPVYRLPRLKTEFEKELLRSILGDDKRDKIDIVPEQLWDEIESALEVRLLARLIRAGHPVPSDRKTLYEDVVRNSIVAGHPQNIICRFAWDAWIGRVRRFSLQAPLTKELLDPLLAARIVIPRGAQNYEFRHDLMRGFLAAFSLAMHSVSADTICKRLEDQRIWDLDRTDQELVWPFFTELIDPITLERVTQFASSQPTLRLMLFEACLRTGQKHNWIFKINIAAAS